MKWPIALLGAGNAATALAVTLARHKCPIHLYAIEDDVRKDINTKHKNTRYLPGIRLPKTLRAFENVAEAVHDARIVIVAVPSSAIQESLTLAAPFLHPDVVIGSITKGLDEDCLLPIATTMSAYLPKAISKRLCLIGGPAIATELARHEPAALLVAGKDSKAASQLAAMLRTTTLKVATSTDPFGVGYCMALKNSYAILLGMCDGLRYPMNTKALIVALAIEEMERLVVAAGGDAKTVVGLAGVGDLIVTGFSAHGRNRTYGERLVGAADARPEGLGLLTVEGISATRLGKRLATRLRVKTPLLNTVAKCLSARHHFERPFIQYLSHLTLR